MKTVVITKEQSAFEGATVSNTLSLPEDVDNVIIDLETIELDEKQLCAFRFQKNILLAGLYYYGTLSPQLAVYFNGAVTDLNAKLDSGLTQRREALISTDIDQLSADQKLLSFLYVHQFSLEPSLDYHSRYGFVIALMQGLFPENDPNQHWHFLNRLHKKQQLNEEALVGELQCCQECESGLLNFKNCCPDCKSIDIQQEDFIHCFACGHSAPNSEFLSQGKLLCRRCQAQLNHIGIDYDKPIENKRCRACKHTFFEPEPVAFCMVCQLSQPPESLRTRPLLRFHLSAQGIETAKGQLKSPNVLPQDFLSLTEFALFKLIVDWQIQCCKRHSQLGFLIGCVNIAVTDATQIEEQAILVAFYEGLRGLLRSTDLISVDDHYMYLYLPFTDAQYHQLIAEKMQQYQQNAKKIDKFKTDFIASEQILESDMPLLEVFAQLITKTQA